MRPFGIAAIAALLITSLPETMSAQCLSNVWQIASRSSSTTIVAKSAIRAGHVVAVASVQEDTDNVWVSRFAEDGTLLGRESKVPGTSDSEYVDLLWNGSEYGLFYVASDDRLTFRRLTGEGDVAAAAVTLLPKIVMVEADDVDVVWDPVLDAYVVARTVSGDDPSLWLTVVERDGSIRSNKRVEPAASSSIVRIARTQSGSVGVFFKRANGDLISYLRFDGSDTQLFRNVWTFTSEFDVTAYDNRFALAKWIDKTNNRQTVVFKIIDTSGQEVVPETSLVTVSEGEYERLPLTLGAGEQELAIGYLDPTGLGTTGEPGFRLLRFDETGATIADTLFAAAQPRHAMATTDGEIVWSGDSWFAAVERPSTSGSDSFLLRMCPLVAGVDAESVIAPGRPLSFIGVAQGGVPTYEYTWTFSDGTVGYGEAYQRSFPVTGSYSVTLTVRDATGTTVSQTMTVTVSHPDTARRRAVRK